MTERFKQFSMRINPAYIGKIRYIAKFNERSTTKEVEVLIRRHIAEFEAREGEIRPEDIENLPGPVK